MPMSWTGNITMAGPGQALMNDEKSSGISLANNASARTNVDKGFMNKCRKRILSLVLVVCLRRRG